MFRWTSTSRGQPAAAQGAAVPERKVSRTGSVVALHSAGRPVWTSRNYAALTRAGYLRNPVVYRAVRMVAESAASVPWLLYERGEEVDEHPLLNLLSRPNPRQSGAEFLEALCGHLLVSGNAYLEAVTVDGAVRELHALRPDRISVVPDASGWPAAFEYSANGRDDPLSPGWRRRCAADAAPGAVPPARRPLRLSRAGGGADEPGRAQCGERLEQGAARQRGAALRCASLQGGGRRRAVGRAVRAAARRAEQPLAGLPEIDALAGGNGAAVRCANGGWEVLQFAQAELIAARTYRLRKLLRGQCGSEQAMLAGAPAGADFVLLDGAVVPLPVQPDSLGRPLRYRFGPVRDDHAAPSFREQTITAEGVGLKPFAPVHFKARREAGSGDLLLSWIRRTRFGGDAWEAADVPLNEEREAYRLDLLDGAEVLRSVEIGSPSYRYTTEAQTADFGALAAVFGVRVAQISAVTRAGFALQEVVHV